MNGETTPSKVTGQMDVDRFISALMEKGLSPEACADEIGVSKNTPRRWMNGSEPLVSKAQRLAALLDLKVDELWPVTQATKKPARRAA